MRTILLSFALVAGLAACNQGTLDAAQGAAAGAAIGAGAAAVLDGDIARGAAVGAVIGGVYEATDGN